MTGKEIDYANEFIDFVNSSPTPYHAVHSIKKKLLEAGFEELNEAKPWHEKLVNGGKYLVTRNESSIVAFTVGQNYENGEGVAIVGAHTDSPCFRIKPISRIVSEGFIQIGVELYGGLIAHTWFDRDLTVAGRVYINDRINGQFLPKLVKIDKPLMRIPTLAIHLNREANTKFEFNKETKLVPIAGQISEEEKHVGTKESGFCCEGKGNGLSLQEFDSLQAVVQRHNRSLVDMIARQLDVAVDDIEDFELLLCDHQKATLGGLYDEFIFSPRLDNLNSCFCATKSLIDSSKDLSQQKGISLISLFDHEEIGSVSAQGAESTFLPDVLQRIASKDFSGSGITGETYHRLIASSFLLSSDMAHGIHPNYSEFYESKNKPQVNGGPVIKINANQRYATNSAGVVLIKKCASLRNVPLQLFVVRNDMPCGSTIGPLLAARLGIRTLDLGNPQLSMHSIRETGGTFDIIKLCDLFSSYFDNYSSVNDSLSLHITA